MRLRSTITLLAGTGALLMTALVPLATAQETIAWQGHGSEHINEACTGYHWIFSPGGGVADVEFHSSEGTASMVQSGGGGGAWHHNSSDDIDLVVGETPSVTFNGTAHQTAALKLSHCIKDDEPFVPRGDLDIAKTALGTWDREVEWELTKSVDKEALSGAPGDTFEVLWEVVATKIDSGPTNFAVSGEIELNWTDANYEIVVDVSDALSDGTAAAVDCDGLGGTTVALAPGDSVTCTYVAEPADGDAETNTATGTVLSGVGPEGSIDPADLHDNVEVTEAIAWSENLTGDDTVTLLDPRFGYKEPISDSTTETFPETFTCPTDPSKYEDGLFTDKFVNKAFLKGPNTFEKASAKVTMVCEVPFVTETVTGAGKKWADLPKAKGNNWFEYSPFAGQGGSTGVSSNDGFDSDNVVDLIQGRPRNLVGSASYANDELCFALDEPFEMADVAGNVKIEPLNGPPPLSIPPGQFSVHVTVPGGETDFCVDVPAATYGYGIHLDAGFWDFG